MARSFAALAAVIIVNPRPISDDVDPDRVSPFPNLVLWSPDSSSINGHNEYQAYMYILGPSINPRPFAPCVSCAAKSDGKMRDIFRIPLRG